MNIHFYDWFNTSGCRRDSCDVCPKKITGQNTDTCEATCQHALTGDISQ